MIRDLCYCSDSRSGVGWLFDNLMYSFYEFICYGHRSMTCKCYSIKSILIRAPSYPHLHDFENESPEDSGTVKLPLITRSRRPEAHNDLFQYLVLLECHAIRAVREAMYCATRGKATVRRHASR
jgi:hypothetical protein